MERRGQLNLLSILLLVFSTAIVGAVAINQSLNASNSSVENHPPIIMVPPLMDLLAEEATNEGSQTQGSIITSEQVAKNESEAMITDEITGYAVSENFGITTPNLSDNQTQNRLSNASITNESWADELVSILDVTLNLTETNQTMNNSFPLNMTNQTIIGPPMNTSNSTKPVLADVIGGTSIYEPSVQEYIIWYHNFSSLPFEELRDTTEISIDMRVGNFDHELGGFIIMNKKYVLDLAACDQRTYGCMFRINGVPTPKIYADKAPNTFGINDEYEIKINAILFDFCDNKRFCDTYFEAYDIVNVSLQRKT